MWFIWIIIVLIAIIVADYFETKIKGDTYNLPEEKEKRRLKKEARKRYKKIESEAYSKYPGIGGQVIKRREYIEKRLRE